MPGKTATIALVLAIIALGAVWLRPYHGRDVTAKKETALERVMRTGTIRCAYAGWAPFFMYDPKTRQHSGINYEIMEAIGKAANLKIEWGEEIGFGNIPIQLSSGKSDVFCSGAWMNVLRGQRTTFTNPMEYSTLYAFVRNDDTRFDGKPEAINNPNTTIIFIEGSSPQVVANSLFPQAKSLALPENDDESQILISLAMGKGDVVILDDFRVAEYNNHNPDKPLRRAAGIPALRVYGAALAVAKGEWELRDMLNVALAEIQLNGTVESIIRKYEKTPGSVLRPAKPYTN